jgi:hypothetical protein
MIGGVSGRFPPTARVMPGRRGRWRRLRAGLRRVPNRPARTTDRVICDDRHPTNLVRTALCYARM